MIWCQQEAIAAERAGAILKDKLLPLATVVTPNIPEAEILADRKIENEADMLEAAKVISEAYHCAVLCKGGHSINDANDFLYYEGKYQWFYGKRIDNPNTHGTGCTLSSAIASNLAKGYSLEDAVEKAKVFINEHPFVKGIEEGTLDRVKFRYYIIQDYLYLEEYAKVFAIGVAKAKSIEIAQLFSKYIAVMNGELNVHNGYMGLFQVSEEEVRKTARSLDNLSYTSYMIRVAYEKGEAEILAAILSCAYSYEVIAKNRVKNNQGSGDDEFYGAWIKGYASDEYEAGNVILLDTLNRLTQNYTEEQVQHLVDIFVVCSKYEMAFWEMSWIMQEVLKI